MRTEDVLCGILLGMLIGIGVFLAVNDIGRDECEKHLPRTQQCKKVWMPAKSAASNEEVTQ